MKKLIVFTLITLLFTTCKKEDLNGPYSHLKGKYTWIGNTVKNCTLCPSYFNSNATADFSAEIEFDESGKVKFYIDNELYLKHKFRISNEESFIDNSNFTIELNIDVPKSKLDIDDKLKVTLFEGDTLFIDKFPYNGYKSGQNLILNNIFIRN